MRCSPEVDAKRISTTKKRFGVENASQNLDIKKKKIETTRKNYGVDHHLQSQEIKTNIKRSNQEKYGVDWTSQRKDVRKKAQQTCLKRYGVRLPFLNEKTKAKQKSTCFKNALKWLEKFNLELYGDFKSVTTTKVKCKYCGKLFKAKIFNMYQRGNSKCPTCYLNDTVILIWREKLQSLLDL